jgi:N-methylhydantoinase B
VHPNSDPFTVEIIQNALQAICDEMFSTLRRTAMSSIIYENLDFGVAITDATGKLACQGSGLPGFIGMLDSGVKHAVAKFGRQGLIRSGDIFMTNDPYTGGVSHLNDVVLVLPVFSEGEMVAWMANKAHWSDIGGMNPGSLTASATEIFQEGLQLPEIKLFTEGEVNQSIIDIIAANSRTPKQTLGDMWAGVAAVRAGEKRLNSILARYGTQTVCLAMARYLEDGRRGALRALKKLPKGTFTAEDTTEDGQSIRVAVTVSDERFTVDLRGNPPQSATPFNCPYMCTRSAAQIIFTAITDPHGITNDGTFECLTVLCDDNSIFNVQRPAPVSRYSEPLMQIIDLVWKAVAPVMPETLPAGQMNSVSSVVLGGCDRSTGSLKILIEPQVGGWGACIDGDGENAQMCAASGETYNGSVEVSEARYGVMIRRYHLRADDCAGSGEHRGGKGIVKEFEVLLEHAWLTSTHTRGTTRPWGMRGGEPGSSNRISVIHANGLQETFTRVEGLSLRVGDVVRVETAAGGGCGKPSARLPQRVFEDQRNGYVTGENLDRH